MHFIGKERFLDDGRFFINNFNFVSENGNLTKIDRCHTLRNKNISDCTNMVQSKCKPLVLQKVLDIFNSGSISFLHYNY